MFFSRCVIFSAITQMFVVFFIITPFSRFGQNRSWVWNFKERRNVVLLLGDTWLVLIGLKRRSPRFSFVFPYSLYFWTFFLSISFLPLFEYRILYTICLIWERGKIISFERKFMCKEGRRRLRRSAKRLCSFSNTDQNMFENVSEWLLII